MYFNVLRSGSKGNATIVLNIDTLIVIDMGISLSTLKEGLQEINKSIEEINAILITHDHTDHISGLRYVENVRRYATKNTLSGEYNIVEPFSSFYIGSFLITPIMTYHDAFNPCGYIIEDDKEKLVYITDTSYIDKKSIKLAKNPTYLILECNHDLNMLMNSKRSEALKKRIRGDSGHLNNEDSAFYATLILGEDTKEIVLAHISEECNTPELALEAYENVFAYKHIDINKYQIKVANQHKATKGGTYEN